MRKRLAYLDIIRIVACLCILIIHFDASICGYDTIGNFTYIQNSLMPNAYWGVYLGDIGTGLFFLLSGACLEYTGNVFSSLSLDRLKSFYYKRCKSLYPMYWIAWIGALILTGTQFSGGAIKWLPPSIIGIDGYLGTLGLSGAFMYYRVGEWFLGCIICLYLIYPFLAYFFGKHLYLTVLVSLVIYAVGISRLYPAWFIFQIPYVLMGIFFMRYARTALNFKLFLFTIILILFRMQFDSYLHPWTKAILLNWALFVAIVFISEMLPIHNPKILDRLSYWSFMTYPMFLVHHQIISHMCKHFNLSHWAYYKTILVFILYLVLTAVAAEAVVRIEKAVKAQLHRVKSMA